VEGPEALGVCNEIDCNGGSAPKPPHEDNRAEGTLRAQRAVSRRRVYILDVCHERCCALCALTRWGLRPSGEFRPKPEVFKVGTLRTLKNIIRTWRLRRAYARRLKQMRELG
jgi:hypothetical protein